MNTFRRTVLLTALISGLGVSSATAAPISLTPEADVNIDGKYANYAHPLNEYRIWIGDGGDVHTPPTYIDWMRGLMRFDLSGLVDLHATADATLRLTFVSAGSLGGSDITVYEMPEVNDDWVEGAASRDYKNTTAVPFVGGSHDWNIIGPIGTATVAGGTVDILIAQSTINDWLANDVDGKISLVLRSNVAEAAPEQLSYAQFYSREFDSANPQNYHPPLLMFDAIAPEPGTMVLLATGGLCLAVGWHRRRKKRR